MCTTALAVRSDTEVEAPKVSAHLTAANENDVVAKPEMVLPANISKDFIDDILKPYRKHAQYLKSAELTHFQDKCSCATKGKEAGLISAKGRFSIDRTRTISLRIGAAPNRCEAPR